MKKVLIVILSAFLLVTAFGCKADKPNDDEHNSENSTEDIEWIKESYFNYLKENGSLDEKYGPKSADDLIIAGYAGTYGDNCVVAYMGGDGFAYTAALRTEQYGENTITFSSGQICYAFYKNQVLTIGEAYEKGILKDDDILKIDAIVGYHE